MAHPGTRNVTQQAKGMGSERGNNRTRDWSKRVVLSFGKGRSRHKSSSCRHGQKCREENDLCCQYLCIVFKDSLKEKRQYATRQCTLIVARGNQPRRSEINHRKYHPGT